MRKSIKIIVTILPSLTLYSFTSNENDQISLTVVVDNFRNENGSVQFALYNKDGTIPDEKYKKYYKILKGEIVNGSATGIGTFCVELRQHHFGCLWQYHYPIHTHARLIPFQCAIALSPQNP